MLSGTSGEKRESKSCFLLSSFSSFERFMDPETSTSQFQQTTFDHTKDYFYHVLSVSNKVLMMASNKALMMASNTGLIEVPVHYLASDYSFLDRSFCGTC